MWAFAVTLWELLSFACEKPYQHLNNDQVIQNAEHMYYGGELQVNFFIFLKETCTKKIIFLGFTPETRNVPTRGL